MDEATIARRYPWTQYKDTPKPAYLTREEDHAFAKENWVCTVRWIVPSSERLDYGWRCESRSFKSEAEALAAAQAPMGVAKSVEALRWNWDVPHTHKERAVSIYKRRNPNYIKRRK